MTKRRVSAEDRAAFARLGRASKALRDEVPPRSMAEVFDRMEAIRAALGRWSEPGEPADEEQALAELRQLRERFVAKNPRPRGA